MTVNSIPPFQTTFAVPLTCESCVKDVSKSLYALPGIVNVTGDVSSGLVHITGTAAPSSIVSAIQSTGRDAILRGSGRPDSAAVCILETHTSRSDVGEKVRGLVRMVQVADELTIFDVAIRGLSEGTYDATIRNNGNISYGAESTGSIWDAEGKGRGVLGTLSINKGGVGSVFLDKPVAIWELIGRSIVVAKQGKITFNKEDPDELVGVIARSAGVWENDKTVCSCSGKTVWEERVEQQGRGML
ncbi:uncharacterized protein PV09_00963 [Verruconis gallopava]|uniref:Superoxide dismutase 1 copper chaperone n=1 Tax=Verruconis gallopava TaxID=253628 RepID=A0A0D2AMV3_9PEZI|nr:uncharacterized protein PV09_00963 [Verruconis gallopava]KIW08018.1 hypothetical protein PV09_00963 [Verruconis gallopava]